MALSLSTIVTFPCPTPLIFLLFSSLSSNRNLHLDTSLNVDDDLLDDLGRGRQVDQALVDAHLVAVPRLGTFTAGRLAGLPPVRTARQSRPSGHTVILSVLVGRRTGPLARRSLL